MKRKVKSILEFRPKPEPFTISNPENGEEFEIVLRPLTPRELTDLNALIRRPKPKEMGFEIDPKTGAVIKDALGKPIPRYNIEDPEYIAALSRANQDFVYAWLIASWEVEIPGETFEDKQKALQENIPNWVFLRLQEKLQEVQGYRESDIARKKKELALDPFDVSNMKSVNDGANG
jgi:hypothetical protein